MKGDNFIRVTDGVLTHETCRKLIEAFNLLDQSGLTYDRQKGEKIAKERKTDTSVDVTEILYENLTKESGEKLLQSIRDHIISYVEMHEVGMFGRPAEESFPMSQAGIKIQMTKPSEGYHVWHCENGGLAVKGRFLAWILYLNDIEEGGETEFIHLSERVQPKTGRLVIFPAGWTHAHRGNPPLSNTKYIATGWMEYTT